MSDEIIGVNKQSYDRKIKQHFGLITDGPLNSALYDITLHDVVGGGSFATNYRLRPDVLTEASVRGAEGQRFVYDYETEWSFSKMGFLIALYKRRNSRRFITRPDPPGRRTGPPIREIKKQQIVKPIGAGPELTWRTITPKQHLYAWLQAHEEGLLPEEDPVPRPALIGAALEQELISESELIENKTLQRPGKSNITLDYGLPNEVYNETVRQFKSAYNWSPGRNILITEADIQVAEVNSEVAAKVFGALYLTTDPREFETPFDTPRERVENVWKVFNVFLEINDVEPVSPTNPHNPPKQEFINAFPEAEKKSTPWYPGASSAPQLYVGARLNDVGRWLALKHDIELDDWD